MAMCECYRALLALVVADRYTQIFDGQWIAVTKRNHKHQCCDCGLVHQISFRVVDGIQEIRLVRDKRATAAVRRAFKFTKDGE